MIQSNGEKLQHEYKQRFSGLELYRKKIWKVLCTDFFQKYIPSNSIVLDLGSGYGEFTGNIEASKKYAMDLNPDGKNSLDSNVTFLNQDCSSSWPLENDSLDIVFSSNFLEHLFKKDQIEETLKEAYRSLKKGGKIILVGPNIRFLPGVYWDFWDHYIPITDRSMEEVLKLVGFKIEENIPKFLPYTMSDGKQPPVIFLKIYLKLPFLWKIFGKQFFIIASK